jgi:hypothetical protein
MKMIEMLIHHPLQQRNEHNINYEEVDGLARTNDMENNKWKEKVGDK